MSRSAFEDPLVQHGLELTRGETTTLQINVGLPVIWPAVTVTWKQAQTGWTITGTSSRRASIPAPCPA